MVNKKILNKQVKLSTFRKSLGVFFIIIGTIGLILPFLPGWILIIIGTGFLGYPKVKKIVEEKQKV